MSVFRRKQESVAHRKAKDIREVGLWSRSRVLRRIVWIAVIVIVLVLAVCATTYLSGFDSVLEMIEWYRSSFNF